MKWGYSTGGTKAHFFVQMENPDLNVSLCKKAVSFTIDEIVEGPNDVVNICFACLLAFIQKGRE